MVAPKGGVQLGTVRPITARPVPITDQVQRRFLAVVPSRRLVSAAIQAAPLSLRRLFCLPELREEGASLLGGRAVHDPCRRYVLSQNRGPRNLIPSNMDDVAADRGGPRPRMVSVLGRLEWTLVTNAVPLDSARTPGGGTESGAARGVARTPDGGTETGAAGGVARTPDGGADDGPCATTVGPGVCANVIIVAVNRPRLNATQDTPVFIAAPFR